MVLIATADTRQDGALAAERYTQISSFDRPNICYMPMDNSRSIS